MKRATWAILMAGVMMTPAWAQYPAAQYPAQAPGQYPPQGPQQAPSQYPPQGQAQGPGPAQGPNQQGPNQNEDADHGVARLSLLNGDVTVRRGDTGEVVAGELNAPLVALDHILTGSGSRAEVQIDYSNMIRMGPASEVRLGDMKDGDYMLQVAEGTTTYRVLRETRARVEISTPTVSVRPSGEGIYRVTVRPDGTTEVTVRAGQAEIFTPKGSEILRSGKTMVARGTAADPEYMISAAIPRDDWDKWNDNRDQDMQRAQVQSAQYVSPDVYGTESLAGYGQWIYDPAYGYVWVPTVSAGWAPYRVGRWSYVNYYGWSWVSGDPWGWAPYHYGRWYSSPYGWAWYPGPVAARYYWSPALVGFFGWGTGGFGVGVGFGFGAGWGYGNVGWVPLAPYEVYRPWYGRAYASRTAINNTTIVNNTNITNVYRNARQFNGRDGVTSVQASNFGRQGVSTSNFVRANNQDLARAGQVQGSMPFQGNAENRRFSDRNPSSTDMARATNNQNRQFATAGNINNPGRRAEGATAGVNNAAAVDRSAGAVDRGRAGGPENVNVIRGNSGPSAVNNVGANNAGANNSANSGGGWRRFDPSTATANNGGSPRGNASVANNSVANSGAATGGERVDRSRSVMEPRGYSQGNSAASVNAAPSTAPRQNGFSDRRAQYGGSSPYQQSGRSQVNAAPAPRNSGTFNGGGSSRPSAAPAMQAPRSYSGGGGGSRPSGGGSHSSGGGGSHGGGGGHGGHR